MSDAVELIEITFDNLENKQVNAISRKSLGIFISDENLTAQGNVARFITRLPNINVYLGHDGEVYPKYELINHKLK